MSVRGAANTENIGDRVIALERQVAKLQGLVNASLKTSGYVLVLIGPDLYIRSTNAPFTDTLIATP